MPVIAVAGGTGGVGIPIIEVLLQHSTYKVIVLTRNKPKSAPVLDKVQHIQVDYSDVSLLANAIQKHEIDTIISTIGIYSDETSQAQLNLIQAAEKSTVTKRFIPSEYSFIQTESLLRIDPSIKYFLDSVEALKKAKLQYTRVVPGFFMDYWGMPHVRTHLSPFTFGIDIQNCQAAIPGDGNDVMCMTYTYDMAHFIARLLETENWPEFSVIVGDEVTYNQLLALAEEIRGKKFDTVYVSAGAIQEGKVTVPKMPVGCEYSPDELIDSTVLVSQLTIARAFQFPPENRLNERFPDLQTTNMKEFLARAWKDH